LNHSLRDSINVNIEEIKPIYFDLLLLLKTIIKNEIIGIKNIGIKEFNL
jgi:hypothetical protein